MTVNKDRMSSAVTELVERFVVFDQAGHQRGKRMTGGEAETDTESGGSSTEEGESPRSVAMWRRRKATAAAGCLHSQVLRVMEEDLHLGEDIFIVGGRECDHSKPASGKTSDGVLHTGHQIVILSRTALPSSPLSGKGGSAVMTTD